MAGSSATVNGQAGKYIITSGLSLPEGFTVNYSIQRKAGQREKGGRVGRKGGKEKESKLAFLLSSLLVWFFKQANRNGGDIEWGNST